MDREKRKYRDYDADEDETKEKRRRVSGPINVEGRLESLITRVGEKSSSSLENNLEGLAGVLETDIPNYKERILQILCTCITNSPEKTTVYSTLVGLLGAKNPEFGAEFLEMMMKDLTEVMTSGQFERARLMVRFLADLVNCNFLDHMSLLAFFESFIAVTQEENIPQMRSDWFVFCIMSSLAWCGKELAAKAPRDLDKILNLSERYINSRNKLHTAALRVWSVDDPHPQEEYLDCLLAQIKKMKSDHWQEKHIRRPYIAFRKMLSQAEPHTIPEFDIPPHSEGTNYPLPKVVFRMFDYTDAPEECPLPGAHAIERHLVEESIQCIMAAHYKDKKDCAFHLLNCPAKGKLPLDHIIVEVTLGQLFQLPTTPHVPIFYGALLIELCKLQPNSMPGVIAQSVQLLFERLDTMNVTCIDRFIDWFTFHLSNFEYKWTWEDWSHYARSEKHTNVKKVRFIREVLTKCMRLSYYQSVMDFLPEPMHPLLPQNPQGNFRFEGESGALETGNETVKKLIAAIKGKKESDSLLEILEEVPFSATSNLLPVDAAGASSDFASFRLELFLLTILRAGVKSISHTYSALTKFLKVFKEIVNTEKAERHCLTITREFWRRNDQMMIIVIDKLIKLQIVTCNVVVNWLFSKDMRDDFQSFYVWEIMHSTLKKVLKRKSKAEKDLADATEKVQRCRDRIKRQELKLSEASDRDNDEVEKMNQRQAEADELYEKHESAQTYQKQLFLIVFQSFIMVLTEHIVQCEQQQTAVVTPWFKYALQRLQETLLTYHEEIFPYVNTLESIIFTVDLDSNIMRVFESFKKLRA